VDSGPIARFYRWFRAARRAGVPIPEAMALATVGRGGAPAVRFVLLKHADARGFVFFTDTRSPKGRALRRKARAALVFYWDLPGRQVRISGRVEPVSSAEADTYWSTRPRESQLAAFVSSQSARLPGRASLMVRWRRLRSRYRDSPIPRPPYWTGLRVVPDSIEFWTRRPHRLHHRELFTRTRRGWNRQLLQP